MHFLGIVFLFCHLCPVVADPIKVQTQQRGVVGSQQAEEQVLNGVSFTSQNQEFNTVVKNTSADTLLPALISANKTPALNPDVPDLQFLIPIVAVVGFALLSIASVLMYKKKGLRHPGGILGSVVHYHRDITGMA